MQIPKKIFFLFGLIFSGCTHTWVSGTVYYPSGSDHTNSKYYLLINIEGAAGYAYVDRTKKKVTLTVKDKAKRILLQRQYEIMAGDLKWIVKWDNFNQLSISLYEDINAGEKSNTNKKTKQNIIKALNFSLDKSMRLDSDQINGVDLP